MMKEKLNRLISRAVVLDINNIDTDQIIPARFLKATGKEGFGEKLFWDWRYDQSGNPLPDSPLKGDDEEVRILIAGRNFGCGSSREHAAWAIQGYGFRVVISPSFADIFRNNALNCGLLPAEISHMEYLRLLDILSMNPDTLIKIDIENQSVTIDSDPFIAHFPISDYKKECFINGFDDIDYLLTLKTLIETHEEKHCPVAW